MVCTSALVMSCQKDATIQVENMFDRTYVENVYWGDVYIGSNLSPRQQTDVVTVVRRDAKLPVARHVYFNKAGSKTIQYYTKASYELAEGQDLFIQLNDTTVYYQVED